MALLVSADIAELVDVYRGSESSDNYGYRSEAMGNRVATDVRCTIQPALRWGGFETPPYGEFTTKTYEAYFLSNANIQAGDNLYRTSTTEWFLVEHVARYVDPEDASVQFLRAELSVPAKPLVQEASP